jgi:cell fate (sporulation/competence/biofilm development) regulator YlbF (YheA/YmcA/DUF963 family)
MGFFGSKKKNVIDLTEGYRRERIKSTQTKPAVQEKSSGSSEFVPLGFFADSAPQKESFSENSFDSGDAQERKRKLAKRLVDMTDKIEDLSNQVYHLQQRLELLERKIMPDSGQGY